VPPSEHDYVNFTNQLTALPAEWADMQFVPTNTKKLKTTVLITISPVMTQIYFNNSDEALQMAGKRHHKNAYTRKTVKTDFQM